MIKREGNVMLVGESCQDYNAAKAARSATYLAFLYYRCLLLHGKAQGRRPYADTKSLSTGVDIAMVVEDGRSAGLDIAHANISMQSPDAEVDHMAPAKHIVMASAWNNGVMV